MVIYSTLGYTYALDYWTNELYRTPNPSPLARKSNSPLVRGIIKCNRSTLLAPSIHVLYLLIFKLVTNKTQYSSVVVYSIYFSATFHHSLCIVFLFFAYLACLATTQ